MESACQTANHGTNNARRQEEANEQLPPSNFSKLSNGLASVPAPVLHEGKPDALSLCCVKSIIVEGAGQLAVSSRNSIKLQSLLQRKREDLPAPALINKV